MSLARFVRNSTGGFVPSNMSATPMAASPRLNVSVVMSSTEIVMMAGCEFELLLDVCCIVGSLCLSSEGSRCGSISFVAFGSQIS